MDVLTHGFVPYAVLTWLRRPRSHRAAAALGAISPDLDTLFAWASHAHGQAYPLVHRGFSHTLWGAPIMALAALFLFSRPILHRRWARLAVFRWTPDMITPLWLGAVSHLLLDGVTITGIPLLWPFETTRYTTNWFFFGIFALIPFSFFALLWLARGRGSDRMVKLISIIVLAIFLLAGGLRYASYPRDAADGSHITPGTNDWTWYVSTRNETGTSVYQSSLFTNERNTEFFAEPDRDLAATEIARCQAQASFTVFAWDLWAPATVNVTQTPDGGRRLEFRDPVQRYLELHPPYGFSGLRRDDSSRDAAICNILGDGQVLFERPRGWFGS